MLEEQLAEPDEPADGKVLAIAEHGQIAMHERDDAGGPASRARFVRGRRDIVRTFCRAVAGSATKSYSCVLLSQPTIMVRNARSLAPELVGLSAQPRLAGSNGGNSSKRST
jgi:hypothetical protein